MTDIILKTGTTPGMAPTALLPGEPAVDVASGALRMWVGDATGAPFLIGGGGIETYGSVAEAAAAEPSGAVIKVLGYAAPGDSDETTYRRVGETEPEHPGKFLTAGGVWWELHVMDASPLMFGAIWDNVTDDTDAINACADYCRATFARMRLPPRVGWAAGTLYLGMLDVYGNGSSRAGVTAGFAAWYQGSASMIRLGGNPGIIKGAAGAAKSGRGRWRDFDLVGVGPSFSGNPIDLYDIEDFDFQIGVAAGRNIREFLSRGNPIADGSGFGTIENVSFDGFSGWAFYAHMAWGQSLLRNCTFHGCGGEAADHYDDDLKGGIICFDNSGVDWVVRDIHALNHAYADGSPFKSRGTAFRVGSKQEDVMALPAMPTQTGANAFVAGGNQHVDKLHFESFKIPLAVFQSNNIRFDNLKMEGENIMLGWPGNPGGHGRVHLGRWAPGSGSIEGAIGTTVWIAQGSIVDLGTVLMGDGSQPLIIDYRGTFRGRVNALAGYMQQGLPSTSVSRRVFLRPNFSLADTTNPANWFPFADFDYPYRAAESDNLLPPIPDPVAAPYAFSGTGVVQQRRSDREVRIARGGSGDYSEFSATVTGLTPAALYTLAWRGAPYVSTLNMSEITFGVRGTGAAQFEDVSRVCGTINSYDASGTLTGTVSLAQGSRELVGTGTAFDSEIREGTRVLIDGATHTVVRVDSDTTAWTLSPHLGADAVDQTVTFEFDTFRFTYAINFLAPNDGEATVFVRTVGSPSLIMRDLTLVEGLMPDFRRGGSGLAV